MNQLVLTTQCPLAALDIPFLLLPFRPTSDPSAAKSFIRNFFSPPPERTDRPGPLQGSQLAQELRLSEPMVRVLFFFFRFIQSDGRRSYNKTIGNDSLMG